MRKHLIYILLYLFDILLLFVSFFIMTLIKGVSFMQYVDTHSVFLLILIIIWLLISMSIRKVPRSHKRDYPLFVAKVILADTTIIGITVLLIFAFGQATLSRLVVFGTMVLGAILEILFGRLFFKLFFKEEETDISPSEEESVEEEKSSVISDEKIKIKRMKSVLFLN